LADEISARIDDATACATGSSLASDANASRSIGQLHRERTGTAGRGDDDHRRRPYVGPVVGSVVDGGTALAEMVGGAVLTGTTDPR
jgi:hypothetical protein